MPGARNSAVSKLRYATFLITILEDKVVFTFFEVH